MTIPTLDPAVLYEMIYDWPAARFINWVRAVYDDPYAGARDVEITQAHRDSIAGLPPLDLDAWMDQHAPSSALPATRAAQNAAQVTRERDRVRRFVLDLMGDDEEYTLAQLWQAVQNSAEFSLLHRSSLKRVLDDLVTQAELVRRPGVGTASASHYRLALAVESVPA